MIGGPAQRAVWRIIAVLAIAVAPAVAAFLWWAEEAKAFVPARRSLERRPICR
jgi:hypothetical protein